jgi:hypothetical protein
MSDGVVEYALTKQEDHRSKAEQAQAEVRDVTAKATFMSESPSGFALGEKAAQAAATVGNKIVSHYRNRAEEPLPRINPQKKILY